MTLCKAAYNRTFISANYYLGHSVKWETSFFAPASSPRGFSSPPYSCAGSPGITRGLASVCAGPGAVQGEASRRPGAPHPASSPRLPPCGGTSGPGRLPGEVVPALSQSAPAQTRWIPQPSGGARSARGGREGASPRPRRPRPGLRLSLSRSADAPWKRCCFFKAAGGGGRAWSSLGPSQGLTALQALQACAAVWCAVVCAARVCLGWCGHPVCAHGRGAVRAALVCALCRVH